MYNRMKNIEIPENLFSNLGKIPPKPETKKEIDDIETIHSFEKDSDLKLMNYNKHNEYRDRITKMYKEFDNIKPIDNEIDNVLYFNNYIEKGIVIKPKVSSLKQFWTEYRLINNEKIMTPTIHKEENELDNFDRLFEELSIRVNEINNYIDELKGMKNNLQNTSLQLKADKEKLQSQKMEFINYKEEEENKIQEEKETLKINFERLQTIIDDLNKKLESIDE